MIVAQPFAVIDDVCCYCSADTLLRYCSLCYPNHNALVALLSFFAARHWKCDERQVTAGLVNNAWWAHLKGFVMLSSRPVNIHETHSRQRQVGLNWRWVWRVRSSTRHVDSNLQGLSGDCALWTLSVLFRCQNDLLWKNITNCSNIGRQWHLLYCLFFCFYLLLYFICRFKHK